MEKTGLISKITRNTIISWEAYQIVNQSQEVKKYNESLAETLTLLKAVKSENNIALALGAEEVLLRQELTVYANSPEQRNSVVKAINQLQEARESLSVVGDDKAYQTVTKTYGAKDRESGLPLDSCRKFLKSHTARLTNQMASNLSVPEKNILRQRKENLGMVKEVYMALQRQALGLPAPAKGLAR